MGFKMSSTHLHVTLIFLLDPTAHVYVLVCVDNTLLSRNHCIILNILVIKFFLQKLTESSDDSSYKSTETRLDGM